MASDESTSTQGTWRPSKADRSFYKDAITTASAKTYCTSTETGGDGPNPAWENAADASADDLAIAKYACNHCPLQPSCRQNADTEAFQGYPGVLGGVIPSEMNPAPKRKRSRKRSKAKTARPTPAAA